MKHIFIINPAAGKGVEAKRLVGVINDACSAAGEDFSVYETQCRGDAVSYVKKAISQKPQDEVYRFYACGGDGTLNEVVSGAISTDGENPGPIPGVEVGCIPVGTGNDFVRNFTNPEFFFDITKQILADSTVIDCYSCGEGLYGINMINIGFDCEVAVRAAENKKKKYLPKSLAYVIGVISELKKNMGKRMAVSIDGVDGEMREYQLVSIANGGFCGGGFHSAPRTLLNDGSLDISLIDKVSRFNFIRLVLPYKKGTHLKTSLGRKVVHYSKITRATISFEELTNVCIDGEIVKRSCLELSVMPSALAFAIPVGCEVSIFDL